MDVVKVVFCWFIHPHKNNKRQSSDSWDQDEFISTCQVVVKAWVALGLQQSFSDKYCLKCDFKVSVQLPPPRLRVREPANKCFISQTWCCKEATAEDLYKELAVKGFRRAGVVICEDENPEWCFNVKLKPVGMRGNSMSSFTFYRSTGKFILNDGHSDTQQDVKHA